MQFKHNRFLLGRQSTDADKSFRSYKVNSLLPILPIMYSGIEKRESKASFITKD